MSNTPTSHLYIQLLQPPTHVYVHSHAHKQFTIGVAAAIYFYRNTPISLLQILLGVKINLLTFHQEHFVRVSRPP